MKKSPRKTLEGLRQRFSDAEAEYSVCVTDSSVGLEGYLVIWNLPEEADPDLGIIAKGGTRITPDLNLEQVQRLAKTMALKNATAALPIGGAKSGIRANPDSPDIEHCYRCFARKLSPLLAENGGPFGGFGFDIGARAQQALWVCDELQSKRSFTGKSVEHGGTDYDREGIAGLGVAVAARVTLAETGFQGTPRFAVQGVGAMGAGVIRYYTEFGAELAVIADPRLGGCFELRKTASVSLLDALIAMDFERSKEELARLEVKPQPIDSILSAEVDVLFPCALQDTLTRDTIDEVKAQYIVEGANNPSTAEAKRIFAGRQGVLIPDVLANPGGIIAAFVELKSGAGVSPPAGISLVAHAKQTVVSKIEQNVRDVLQLAQGSVLDPSEAAELLALSRLYPQR